MNFLCLLCISAAILLSTHAQSHNVTWGARQYPDYLLARKIIDIKASVFQIMKTEYLFKPKGVAYVARITQIRIIDWKRDGRGGYASLLSGGPQQSYAKIQFKSQRGRSMKFLILIYGY